MPDEEVEVVDSPQSDDSEARKRLEVFRKQAQLLIKGSQDAMTDLSYLRGCKRPPHVSIQRLIIPPGRIVAIHGSHGRRSHREADK